MRRRRMHEEPQMTLERKGERLAVDQASQPRPPGGGAFLAPNMSQTQIIANSHRVFGHLAFFGQPAKCEAAHTSFPFSPSKFCHSDIYLAPGGVHGTKTKTS